MQSLPFEQVTVDEVYSNGWQEKNISLSVLRLDKIHPIISGNKWFKLKYHLEQFRKKNYEGIVTFGGAYSNHIVATACAGSLSGIKTVGIIRGEKPEHPGHTLVSAADFGMQLHHVPRNAFDRKNYDELLKKLYATYPNHYFIPEGGGGLEGQKGSEEILSLLPINDYTHIACAIGTGTMFLGIANSSGLYQQILGFPVLKLDGILDQKKAWLKHPAKNLYCKVFDDYHFGGYAKKTDELIGFMNEFYQGTGIPTDFVYTGKLFFGVYDLAGKGFFKDGSKILAIHSGGLQGNLSLPKDLLIF
jgi:1-aminocyclopropane-1-carboxylate deaminase